MASENEDKQATQVTMDLGKLKGDYVEQTKEKGIDPDKRGQYMKGFYESRPTPAVPDEWEEPLSLDQIQVLKMCEYARDEIVLENFSLLSNHFKIQGGVEANVGHQKDIKESMESIMYVVSEVTNLSKEEFAEQYQDRQFECGAGTLTNLQAVVSEMTLANQGLAAYVIEQKRETMEQIVREGLHEGDFDVDFKRDPVWIDGELTDINPGMETHDVQSLLAVVAPEYGIVGKDRSEDEYIKLPKDISDQTKEALRKRMADSLAKPEVIDTFIDGVAQKILVNLPKYSKEKYGLDASGVDSFAIKIGEVLKDLEIDANINTIVKMEYGASEGYKDNLEDIIRDLVLVEMEKKGLVASTQIELAKMRVNIEKSLDPEDGTLTQQGLDSIPGESLSQGLIYMMKHGIRIDDFSGYPPSPIDYAKQQGKQFEGMDPLEYSVRNGFMDGEKSAAERAIEEGFTIQGTDVATFAILEGLPIAGINAVSYTLDKGIEVGDPPQSPLKYAIDSGVRIDDEVFKKAEEKSVKLEGLEPILYAKKEGKEIGDMDPIVYAISNSLKIEGRSALDYALSQEDLTVNGVDITEHLFGNDTKIEGISAAQYMVDQGIKIKQNGKEVDPVIYAGEKKISIGELDSFQYAIKNGVQIDDKEPLEHIISTQTAKVANKYMDFAVENNKLSESAIMAAAKKGMKIKYRDPILYAKREGIMLEGKDPILYAAENSVRINKKEAMQYATTNTYNLDDGGKGVYEIDGMPAIEYAVQNGMKIGAHGLDPIEFATLEKLKIKGMDPLYFAMKEGKEITGLKPEEYIVKDTQMLQDEESIKEVAAKYKEEMQGQDKLLDPKPLVEDFLKLQREKDQERAREEAAERERQKEEIRQRQEAEKARAVEIARAKAEEQERARAEAEARAKEERAIAEAEAKARAEEQNRAAAEAREKAKAARKSHTLKVISQSPPDLQADRLSQEFVNESDVWKEWVQNNPIDVSNDVDPLLVSSKIYAKLESDETKRAEYAARKVVEYADRDFRINAKDSFKIIEPLIADDKKAKIEKNAEVILRAATKHKNLPFKEKVKKVFNKISMALGITPKEVTKLAKQARASKKTSFKEKIQESRRDMDRAIQSSS